METKENILKELKEIAPKLASMEKKNFYSVPENYFLDFKNGILEQVKLGVVKQELKTVAPELLNIEKKNLAEVPANYFNSFSVDLLKKIRANEVAAELNQIAPTLSAIEEKTNRLEVPANYFNAFPQQMMKRIATEQKAQEVASKPNWVDALNIVLEKISVVVFKPKYSFAFAGMATVLIVGVMLFTRVEQPTCSDLACLPEAKNITDEDLIAYLDNGDAYHEEVFEMDFTGKPIEEQAFKDVLKEVSNEDLDNAILD